MLHLHVFGHEISCLFLLFFFFFFKKAWLNLPSSFLDAGLLSPSITPAFGIPGAQGALAERAQQEKDNTMERVHSIHSHNYDLDL